MTYSNSPLVDYTKLSPHNSGERSHTIDRITPHHVVGLMSVEALGAEFNGTRDASSNYGIGADGRVGLYVEESNRSHCSSNTENDQRAITIECADEPSWPYEVPDVVWQKLIKLCVDICRRNGKRKLLWISDREKALAYEPKEDEMVLTMHKWFAYTLCPGKTLEDRMPELAKQVTAQLYDNTPSAWGKEAVEWAISVGLLAGDNHGDLMLRSPITREQMCVMLKKFHDIM